MTSASNSGDAHARTIAAMTEADEGSATKADALTRLSAIVRAGETYGVIGMYEATALRLGATWAEIGALTRRARAA